jgi:hypothetical protein
MQPTVIDNFISEKLSKDLNSFLRPMVSINDQGVLSKQIYSPLQPIDSSIYNESQIMYLLIESVIKSIQNVFGFSNEKISINRVLYQVLRTGEKLAYHADGYGGGGVEGYGTHGYSALLYLNDNYTGGDIVFYNDDSRKSYHPKIGTLIYFKGDEDHYHSVNKVIKGERLNLILFFDVKDF